MFNALTNLTHIRENEASSKDQFCHIVSYSPIFSQYALSFLPKLRFLWKNLDC